MTAMVDEQKLTYVPSNWLKCGELCHIGNNDDLLVKWFKFNTIPKVNANYKSCLLSSINTYFLVRPPSENAIVITQKHLQF